MVRSFLFLAVLMLGVGLLTDSDGDPPYEVREARRLQTGDGVSTEGTVVRLEAQTKQRTVGSRKRKRIEEYDAQCPVYRYRVPGVDTPLEHVSTDYGCDSAAVGDTVELIYERDDPHHALVNDETFLAQAEDHAAGQPLQRLLWFGGAILCLAVALTLGAGGMARRRRGSNV